MRIFNKNELQVLLIGFQHVNEFMSDNGGGNKYIYKKKSSMRDEV